MLQLAKEESSYAGGTGGKHYRMFRVLTSAPDFRRTSIVSMFPLCVQHSRHQIMISSNQVPKPVASSRRKLLARLPECCDVQRRLSHLRAYAQGKRFLINRHTE